MPPGQVVSPAPFPFAPAPAAYCGQLPYPVGPPPPMPVCPGFCALRKPRYTLGVKPACKSKTKPEPEPERALTATETDSSDDESSSDDSDGSSVSSTSSESTLIEEPLKKVNKKDKSCASSSTSSPPGTKLPGGLRKGTGYLYTGKPCSFHIIDGAKVNLKDLTDVRKEPKKFGFRIYTAQDNSTVTELIEALGGGDGASVTQMWEWGNGWWKEGSRMEKGGEKAGRRLSELGWSEAGSKKRAPVWLYFKRK